MGDPAMTEHLGGPEAEEKLADRQARYAAPGSGMFKIVDEETGEGIGSAGYWERSVEGEPVWEVGWSVIPAFQGRGVATQAMKLVLEKARDRAVWAYPSVDNGPSNALCRKLGFTLVEQRDFEYPPGSWMRCNCWRLDPG